MRVSVLETETLESQSQLSNTRLRLLKVILSFETKPEKLLLVETETRIWSIFKTVTTRDRHPDVETEAETDSLADLLFRDEFM